MSSQKRIKNKSKRRSKKPGTSSKKRQFRGWWIASGLVVIAAVILLFAKVNVFRTVSGDPASTTSEYKPNFQPLEDKPDFQSLVGDWVRPDGGYVIKVRHVDKSGRVDAGYFNPNPITVSTANASVETGRLNLFIKLQGKRYPGSTYTLIYNKENETLVGIYYQAALGQYFDVAFVRKIEPGSQ